MNNICKSCAAKKRCERPEELIRLRNQSKKMVGEKNPFFGKTHSIETKDKIRSTIVEKQLSKGCNNPMFGKTVYQVWVEKYGKEEADKKYSQMTKKQSQNSSGSNNPMFGKPSPRGSGNGWKGWYKGHFFRSLRELSFIVSHLEKYDLKWESAESKKLSIPYIDYHGKNRTYFADFFCENTLIECKPKSLIDSPSIKIKIEAAKKFCEDNGYKYEIIDPSIISIEMIDNLIKDKSLKFTEKYQQKYTEYKNKLG